MVTYFSWFQTTKKIRNTFRRMRYGKSLYKLLEGSKHYTMPRFFTVIWSQPTSSWARMALLNLGTWMSARSLKRACFILKQALHIMLLQKYGVISLTITSLTFGPLAAFFMKQLRLSLPSELRTCRAYTRRCSKEFILRYLASSPVNWPKLSSLWSKCNPKAGLIATKFLIYQLLRRSLTSFSRMIFSTKWTAKWIF